MSKASRLERLAELKRMDVQRCSLVLLADRIVPGGVLDSSTWKHDPPAVEAALDAHLRHFAYFERNGDLLCPSCQTTGWFGWGVIHGQGTCSCGWPGTLYHSIADPAPDAPCRYCEEPKSRHVAGDGDGRPRFSCQPREGNVGGGDIYRPRDIARLTMLLWAHPNEVSTAGGSGRKRARR